GFFVTGPFQHSHHLENPDAAGARWRGSYDAVVAIFSDKSGALHRGVLFQVVQSDQPAILGHRIGEKLRSLAFIEACGAELGDPLQRLRQIWLNDSVARLITWPAFQVNRLGCRVARKIARTLGHFGERVRNWEALRSKFDGGLD